MKRKDIGKNGRQGDEEVGTGETTIYVGDGVKAIDETSDRDCAYINTRLVSKEEALEIAAGLHPGRIICDGSEIPVPEMPYRTGQESLSGKNRRFLDFREFAELWDGSSPIYEVYQLKDGDAGHQKRYTSWNLLERLGLEFNGADYELVYAAPLEGPDDRAALEKIYSFLNQPERRPFDYRGTSMSVSDVIVIRGEGKEKAYYVDSIGFKEADVFLKHRSESREAYNIYHNKNKNIFYAKRSLNNDGAGAFQVEGVYFTAYQDGTGRCFFDIYDSGYSHEVEGKRLLGKRTLFEEAETFLQSEGLSLADSHPVNPAALLERVAKERLGIRKYKVEITETLQRIVEVEARTQEEANIAIGRLHRHGEIVLDTDDYKAGTIKPYIESPGKKQKKGRTR